MAAYKMIAVLLAYGALWQALGQWRVRHPERRFQLQLYGCVALLYVLLAAVTAGMSPSLLSSRLPPAIETLSDEYIRGYFGSFATIFSLLGLLEIGVGVGFYDPSLPLLSRWWMRALFEGPVWRHLCDRSVGSPLTVDEAQSAIRHILAGIITLMSAFWALQVAVGSMEWGHLDPVALVIVLKAINLWLDARLRPRETAVEIGRAASVNYSVPACLSRVSRPTLLQHSSAWQGRPGD